MNATHSSLPAVSAELASRADELARAWLETIRAGVDLRADQIFPGEGLLDHMPGLVRWVVRTPDEEQPVPDAIVESVNAMVRLRWRQHVLLDEILLEAGMLEGILFEALEEGVVAREVPARDVLVLSRALARRVTALLTLAAAAHTELVDEVRRNDRRKLDDFTRMVSHEMRTPIGAAFTAARALEEMGEGLAPTERARLLSVVGRGLLRATSLLESVMSLTLGRSGRDEAGPRRLLRDVVADTVTAHHDAARGAGVVLEVPTAVPAVDVDARRVELILTNLVGNAIRYADAEKRSRWVHVRVERERERLGWRVQVVDNGVGIAKDDQARVFRRFFRVRSDLSGGTGLGLVIAREAAEQLGSDLEVESVPGVGSTFHFVIPDAGTLSGG